MLRKPKDRDFIRTKDDLLFCVVGYTHPQDRLLSYLKYVPSEDGKWVSGDTHYKRMIPYYSSEAIGQTFPYLKEKYPQYLYFSKVNNMTFPAVPYQDIKKYYRPEEKLNALADRGKELDSLQSRAVELAAHLSNKARISMKDIGITGSILLDIHNVSFSDIDMTVCGSRNALLVKRTLLKEYLKPSGQLRRLNSSESEEWCKRKTKQFSMDYESASLLLKKKWNFGYYKERFFSIHPTKLDSEITERYGQQQYAGEGIIEIIAKVRDDSWTLFNPSNYKVSQVQIVEGPKVSDISEVVTFEGAFSDIASDNESIRVKGNLETVVDTATKEKYHRVVVGSKNMRSPEYVLPMR